jgi:predicted nucleotidyltransferase
VIEIVAERPRRRSPTLAAIRDLREEIVDVVSSFGGSNVRVFGSVARGDADEHSDVDLLIDVPSGTGLFTVEGIAEALEAVVPWRVDVMTSGAARGRMAHVLDEAVPL